MAVRLTQKLAEKNVFDKCAELNCTLIEFFVFIGAKDTRFRLKCNIDNHEWESSYKSFIYNSGGCKICASKKTADKLRTPLKEVNKNVNRRLKEIDASLRNPFVYENKLSKLELKCNIDGHEWEPTYESLVKEGRGCPRCAGQVVYQKEALEEVNKRLKKINASLREPLLYIGSDHTRLKLICNIDGHEWETVYHNFVNNKTGCAKCNGKFLSKEDIENNINRRLKEINATLTKPYIHINNESMVSLKCNIDDHEWKSKYTNFVSSNKGCAKCAGVLKYTQEEAEEQILERCNIMNYKLVKPFIYLTSQTTIIELECNDCEYTWNTTHSSFMAKHGCPRCSASKGEIEIEKILKEKKISYITEKTFKECKDVGFLKFDFYLPEKNICIEYDGIQHFEFFDFFGGEKGLKTQQKRDKIKTKYCIDYNIELIRIPYNQFNNIKNILLDIV